MNFKTFDNPSVPDLIAILRSQAMMFGKLLMIINCKDYFSKKFEDKELKEIETALEDNPENIDIIFVAKFPRNSKEKLDARKKLFKILSKYNVEEFPTFKTYKIADISNWINKTAKTKDIKINAEAMDILIQQIGNNLREYDLELDKLKLFAYPEKTITKAHVKEICISNEDLFNFTEMLMIGQTDKALLEFKKLTKESHPLKIIAAVQTMLRKWIFIKQNSSKSPSELSKLVGLHEYIVKLNLNKMKNRSLKDLVKLKENLTNAEYKIKLGLSFDEEMEVQNAIMR